MYPVVGSNGVIGYHSRALVRGPGIVIGRKGTIGAVTWIDSDFWPIDTTYYVKTTSSDVDLKWIFYELVHSNLPKLSLGDVVPGLKRELANNLIVPLPPLSEQRAIVGVLGVVDSAIELADKVIAKTERLKKGLMQQLLTRCIGHKEFKDTEIGKIPKEWKFLKLEQILSDIRYGTSVKSNIAGQGVPVLGIPNVIGGKIDDSDVRYVVLTETELEGLALKQGDILLVRTNANPDYIGRCAMFDKATGIWVYASYLIMIRPDEEKVIPEYLVRFLQSERGRRQFLSSARTSAGNYNINSKGIQSIAISLPDKVEQQRIAEVLSTADAKLGFERKQKLKLERIKRGLMDLLLTGKVRIKVD
jgi:type I restriction enzyme S subunit